MLTRMLLGRGYWEEANDGAEGGGGGAAPDRGDDFTPSEPVVAAAPVEAEAETTPEQPEADKEVDKAEPAVDKEVDKEVDKAEPERDEKGRFIPKSRFDLRTKQLRETEVENRRLREENAALKTGDKATPAPTAADLDAKLAEIDDKIFAARKDGDIETERKLLNEARKVERSHFEAQLQAAGAQASTAAVETMSLDTMIDELESDHTFLDPRSEDFDKERTDQFVELWEDFEKAGYSKAKALLKATALLLPEAPEPKPEPEKPAPRKTDVKRNVDAAKKTPPNLDAVGGLDSDRAGIKDQIQASKLDEKDFAALPASVKARLRGDFL